MIKTKRLTLKPYEDGDQENMIDLLTNEQIKETFMIPDFQSLEQAKKMFQKLKEYSYSSEHYERGIYLQDKLIGFLNDVEIKGQQIELGYVIHPNHHNQGFATEALEVAIKELFQLGYTEVVTGAFEENVASCKVMIKCGMSRIEREDKIEYHGKVHNCIYYIIKHNS
ncbi:GNAT family N-acetyltransferase [Anaerosporobacter faecicola]|uniref:GNAT family N-acetyltransferase n=1 Tax=Anaerosporobacter faecicola TaxID=2718714 RepID=UPI0014387685|nr:GNAT family N-acetyltransferase [Anaerosporobacter faecicola]